ncbi:MAG: cbb3-type cytochrome c oxidase subunit I [Actinomycetota bacterium]
MTLTESAPATEEPTAPPSAPVLAESSPTSIGWFDTADHRRLGRLYVALAIVFGLVALVLDALVKLDRADAGGFVLLDGETWEQTLWLSLDGISFLMLLPLFCGIAIFVVPLQLGVKTIAFPRLAAASFWGFAMASTILIASYAINGGPGGGDADGVQLYLLSLGLLAVSLTAAAVSIATTVLAMRAPGLDLGKVPPFSWASLVTAIMMLVALPAVIALVALLYIDHRYGRVIFGGNVGVGPHLEWLHLHPQILLLAVPTLGVVLEVVPVAAGKRLPSADIWQALVGGFALLSFGAWANQAVVDNVLVLGASGRVIAEEFLYIGMTAAAALPLLGVLAMVGATVAGGRPRISPALVLALVSLLMLLGGVTLAALGSLIDATLADGDFKLRATTWRDGTFALIALGGGLGGLSAGVLWWAPKAYGRTLNPGLAYLQVLAFVGGVTLVAVPSLIAGGIWDLSYGPTSEGEGASEAMAALAAVGSLLVMASLALLLLNLLLSVLGKAGELAGDDPVDGHTLEWATASPPEAGNFAEDPQVTSERPLLDAREAEEEAR